MDDAAKPRKRRASWLLVLVVAATAVTAVAAIFVRRMPDVRTTGENASLLLVDASGPPRGPLRYAMVIERGDEWELMFSASPLGCRELESTQGSLPSEERLDLARVVFPMSRINGAVYVDLGGRWGPPCGDPTKPPPPPPETSSLAIESATDRLRGTLHVDQDGYFPGRKRCFDVNGSYHLVGDGHFDAPICRTPLQRIVRLFRR